MKVGDMVQVPSDSASTHALSFGIIIAICDFPEDTVWQPRGLDRLDYSEWPRKAAKVFVQGKVNYYLNKRVRIV